MNIIKNFGLIVTFLYILVTIFHVEITSNFDKLTLFNKLIFYGM